MLLGVFILSGCSHPSRVPELSSQIHEENGEYRFQDFKNHTKQGQNNTFFAATFSGGGMRATALAYGALKALSNTEAYVPKTSTVPSKLINEFDVVSAVSGGSVTAAYWALYGADGLHNLKDLFLLENVQGQLLASAFHPASLLSLPTPYYSRIDTLSRYFERNHLFGQATYGDLIKRENRPYLVINATDIATGWLFPFIQPQFDLLCADLNGLKLADAVAASTAYPVVFPSLTLENYRSPLSSLTGNGQNSLRPTCPQRDLEQNLENKLTKMDDEVSVVQRNFNVAVTEVERLELEVTTAKARIVTLSMQHIEANAKVTNLKNQLANVETEITKLKLESESANVQVENLMVELSDAERNRKDLETKHEAKKAQIEKSENEIKNTTDNIRGLELHDPIFILVKQWWKWVRNERETESKEVYAQAHMLASAQVEVNTLENRLKDSDSVKRDGETADGLEVNLEHAREQLRAQETELVPLLLEQWLKWMEKQDLNGISELVQSEMNEVARDLRVWNSDMQGEGQGVVRSRAKQWSQWMRKLIEDEDKDELDVFDLKWWLNLAQNLWNYTSIGESIAQWRDEGVKLASKLHLAVLKKQATNQILEDTRQKHQQLKNELKEAKAAGEKISRMIVAAEKRENDLRTELNEAQRMKKQKKKSLKKKLDKKNDLEIYLQRVESLQSEHKKAARNYKKQIIHYGAKDAHFVHLSDGGVADNLGFTFLLELLEDFEKRDKREIERVVILIVDARTGPSNRYASRRSAPNPIDVIRATTGTAIDSKSFLLARELERVTKELKDMGVIKDRYIVNVGFDWITDDDSDSSRGATDSPNDNLKDCQRAFQEIPTNWNLPEEDIEALIDIGEVLVRESKGFNKLLVKLGGEISPSEKTISTVCTRYVKSSMSREENSSSAVADRDR